jgi:hypothetical protein
LVKCHKLLKLFTFSVQKKQMARHLQFGGEWDAITKKEKRCKFMIVMDRVVLLPCLWSALHSIHDHDLVGVQIRI